MRYRRSLTCAMLRFTSEDATREIVGKGLIAPDICADERVLDEGEVRESSGDGPGLELSPSEEVARGDIVRPGRRADAGLRSGKWSWPEDMAAQPPWAVVMCAGAANGEGLSLPRNVSQRSESRQIPLVAKGSN